MKTPIETISAADTAFFLRAQLGPLRNWGNFLADNIRGRQSLAGHTLKPCARQSDGRAFRPIYSLSDVKVFIAQILAAVPSAGRTPVKPTTLSVDSGRGWRINKFDKSGAPVVALCRVNGLLSAHAH